MLKYLMFRYVDAPGDATTVVVVAVLIAAVLVRPGVTVDPDKSTHEACTLTLPAADVMTVQMSLVDVRLIILRLGYGV
jgi:hypothetical protein